MCTQAGKSTLLSKLCGVALPSGSDITTRVPLAIRLQRTAPGEPAGAKVWKERDREPANFNVLPEGFTGGWVRSITANLVLHAQALLLLPCG
jgi:hypothetical protein